MAAPTNLWQVHDTTEPLLLWHLRLPATDDGHADTVVDEALAVLAASGLLQTQRPLPDEVHVYEGSAPLQPSVVTVRARDGALVDETTGDAGALLRRLEGVNLDATYARHFAVEARPFVAAWSTRDRSSVEVCVAFMTTLHFDERDGAVFAANHARVVAARDGLEQLARRRGGRLTAPLGLTRR